jgi:uncharacterized membrane protein YqjE
MAAKLWHKAPFIRLLVGLSAGCLLQWYGQFSLSVLVTVFAVSLICVSVYSLTIIRHRYRFSMINGIAVLVLFSSIGGLLAWTNDIRHDQNWVGHYPKQTVLSSSHWKNHWWRKRIRTKH